MLRQVKFKRKWINKNNNNNNDDKCVFNEQQYNS